MLHPRANSVCMHQVVRDNQVPLTDDRPYQERCWKVPGLNGGQGGYNVRSGGHPQTETVRTLKPCQLGAPHGNCRGSRTGNALGFPRVTDLDKMVSFHSASCIGKFSCLVAYCQEVVVKPDGSQANCIQLYF